MIYDHRTITRESDEHGMRCTVCEHAACVTNVYVVDEDGEVDLRHTCKTEDCIQHVIATYHHSDHREVLVEESAAPMPWEQPAPAGASTPAVAA